MSSKEIIYECPFCGYRGPASDWERVKDQFHCPQCLRRIARKIRPPVVRRVKAV